MACGENYFMFRCEKCGNVERHYITCKQRTCRKCARTRSFQLVEMYLPVVLTFKWACFVTLTLKFVANGNIREQLNKILASFRKLRRRGIWSAEKGVFSVEMVKKDGGYYVHLHALVDSKWMDQGDLSKAWLDITGDSFIVDIRRVKSDRRGLLSEVLKYQTKMWELNDEEKDFVEKTFKHRRFVNSFGIERPEKSKFKGMKCKVILSSGRVCGGNLELFEKEIYRKSSSESQSNYCEELNSS